jgi:hypothetical protein
MLRGAFLAAAALACAAPANAQAFDPAPWLADLEQARQAFHEKYANLEWLEQERGVKVDPLFELVAARMKRVRGEAEAKSLFDRLVQRIGDGHVALKWPEPPSTGGAASASAQSAAPDLCSSIGYDARQNRRGTAQGLPTYQQLPVSAGNPFDAGIVDTTEGKIGVIRIGIFQPQGYPELCRAALRELAIPADKPCDDQCQDKVVTWAYRRMTSALEERAHQLKTAGASVLLVDISNNGGGSEWAEAAARIVTAKPLLSERRGFVRGEHWAKQWADLGVKLRAYAKQARRADRQILLNFAAQADAARAEARKSCSPETPGCKRIATAGYATGLLGSAEPAELDGKEWAVHLFNPAQFGYRAGSWDGPLIVLVDQETWSAAEEFAAVLQDNRAAIVLGARTGGAGCGHTNGGTPTNLKNSGAVLELPDCVRFRADGSNEVAGIFPDEVVALRANDGLALRAKLVAEKLPAAVAKARSLSER